MAAVAAQRETARPRRRSRKPNPKTNEDAGAPMATSETPWVDFMLAEEGVKEIPGAQHNPRIMEYGAKAGLDWKITSDETPWCATFQNWALAMAGLPTTGSAMAKSFLKYGTALSGPVSGALAVFNRGAPSSPSGHIGTVLNFNLAAGTMRIINGNASDEVRISTYRIKDAIAFRWPPGIPLPRGSRSAAAPAVERDYRLGDRLLVPDMEGDDVEEAQVILDRLGYMQNNTEVMRFGPDTEDAVRRFQRAHGLKIDGKIGTATAPAMRDALAEKERRDRAETAAKKTATPAAAVGIGAGVVISAGEPVMNTLDRAMKYNDGTKLGLYIALGLILAVGAVLVWRFAIRRGTREGAAAPTTGLAE